MDEAKTLLKTIRNKNENEFKNHIENKRQDIVSYHLEHNPFYKTFAKNANVLDWKSIPVMTKRHLQQPLQNRLSKGFTTKNIHIHKTSGSSGTPFVFAKDKFCHALTWAGFINRYSWFNIDLNTSKQARFYGIPLNTFGYFKERLKDALSNRYRFSVFDLSDSQFEKNVKKFESTKFDYINGYTSSILQFAKYLQQQNILLKTICPSLKGCIVTSEMLFKEDKTVLETQFGIPVINEYGAAELGLIAFQNKKGDWIINNDDLFVEILDEDDTVLPYGEKGRIVITSLYNKAHPFIRYDLGDIGSLSEQSTLKTPILKSLIGRADDIVILPSGKKAAGLTFYYITKTIIEDNGNVKEFVIEQLKLDTFKIKYTSHIEITEDKSQQIRQAIERYLETGLTIVLERKAQLSRANRGKLKQFKSYLD
ncbi:MAG: phenylacetate--CoA ligase family protein [Algibacter sp.]